MGINERKYAWMDEGWATMLPFDFQTENAPGYDPRSRNAQSYSDFAGDDTDLPMMVPSHQLRGASYRTASYRRPGAAYDFLRQMLGDQKFKSALHEYMKRWNGKHPVPYDFFFTFNNVLGEDLSWYWKPWFFENKYPDLSIDDLKLESGMIKLKIKNIGGIPLPVILKAYYQDGTNENVFNKNADVWKNSADVINVNFAPSKKVIKVELGTNQIPDADNSGNVFDIK
jgi:aminopeptidase N